MSQLAQLRSERRQAVLTLHVRAKPYSVWYMIQSPRRKTEILLIKQTLLPVNQTQIFCEQRRTD